MDYKLRVLESGLRVLTVPMASTESVTLCVWVKTGSRMEEKRTNGISHFLEHMVFKGGVKLPSAKAISTAVDAIGGEFNATTSKDWTNFYIKAATGHIETAFDVLADMVVNPLIKSEEIEREKGTIIQEIAMYEDTPIMKIGDVFEGLAFSGSSLGWEIAGTPKSVGRITRGDFVDYRKSHYFTGNIIVAVAGGVGESKSIALSKKYFSGLISGQSSKLRKADNVELKQSRPQARVKTKKSDQAHFIIGFVGDGRDYKNRFAQSVLSVIMGGGMSSRLFTEVRERRGLAYSVKTGTERYQDIGYIYTYAGVDPGKIEEAVKIILEQHYGLRDQRFKIRAPELSKAKEYLKGHLALALEDTKSVNSFFSEQALFLGKIKTPEEVSDAIDKITAADVCREAKRLFVPNKLNLAIIGPYESSEKFVKLLKQ